jgi:hypothetical protein
MARLDPDVERVERSVSGLLKLLGGTPDERERFWEILKGITTQAEFRLAKSSLVVAERELTTVKDSLETMKEAAGATKAD